MGNIREDGFCLREECPWQISGDDYRISPRLLLEQYKAMACIGDPASIRTSQFTDEHVFKIPRFSRLHCF